jgi:geranylgeranyl diphosphate synthase, type I
VSGSPAHSVIGPADRIRAEVDRVLASALHEARGSLIDTAPEAGVLVDAIVRLVTAGGKRLRPAFCVLGFRAAGGGVADGSIMHAAAALELLHAMALIHDDLIDDASERRGAPSAHVWAAERARSAGSDDAERAGRSLALVAGDLAAVMADDLLLAGGFRSDRLIAALRRYATMRAEMAAGQAIELLGADRAAAGAVARLRGGRYTVTGPLAIGAVLAGGSDALLARLADYGDPLGEAFQLTDDLRDADRGSVDPARIRALVEEAVGALEPTLIRPDVRAELEALAGRVVAG